jgi:presenilin-like A22 family membrane protease
MSAISFIRECISKPINPGPLFIIRNTFLFTLSLFSFSFIINFENKNISFSAFHKPKHYNHIFYCFALHITLVCIFLPAIKIFSVAVAFAYLLSILYTYTHLVSDNHLVRLRIQSKFIYFAGCLKKDMKSPCTHSSPRV